AAAESSASSTLPLHDALPISKPSAYTCTTAASPTRSSRYFRSAAAGTPLLAGTGDESGPTTSTLPTAVQLRRGRATRARHAGRLDRKSTRLNSSHVKSSYAVF